MDSSDLDLAAAAALQSTFAHISSHPENFPEWEDSNDLARLSLEAHQRSMNDGLEVGQAHGWFRIAGDGVRGHSISFNDAGELMQNWQGLVTASGASLSGITRLQGRLPTELEEKTELELTASPAPGSVILSFEPVARAADERYPRGQLPLGEPPEPLAEKAVDTAMTVLGLAANSDDVAGNMIDEVLTQLGPKVASAASRLASSAAANQLDLSVGWDVPGRPRRRIAVTAAQSERFAAILRGHNLDVERTRLVGRLRTISDTRKIEIEIDPADDGQRDVVGTSVVPVDRGGVSFAGFQLHDLVAIDVDVRVTPRPGRGEFRRYSAVSVAAVTDEAVLEGLSERLRNSEGG